ncbi:hypothetical protein Nepgr_007267 [Nepenthes gracilis]|uniref:Uncharacterized protein n=1 Tax=Nepenthes gracilis TaxID=150966 RepID=A0AAD3XI44_NEPGR|nr:hypothetical protein Nepgr_007267 [Nepenthes gracilis]
MASFYPPITSTTATTVAASNPIFPRTSQLSIFRKQNPHFTPKISCKASTKNDNQNPQPSNAEKEEFSSWNKLDRRNVLIGLGGLCGGATSTGNSAAFAAPLAAPEVTKCGKADLPAAAKGLNCCPPATTKVVEFRALPPSNGTPRVRPAAHLANREYIEKNKKALSLMKGLPDSDPRSFTQQANVHCAYCDGAYHQVGFPDLNLQVHNS